MAEFETELFSKRAQLITELDLFLVKTLVTLNSGAFIVLLTFVGNVGGNASYVIDITSLRYAFSMFVVGIAFSFFSVFINYIVTSKHMAGEYSWFDVSISRFILVMLAPCTVSFMFFVAGTYWAVSGVSLKITSHAVN